MEAKNMSDLKRFVAAAQGKTELDLLITGCEVVNVFTSTIQKQDIGIVEDTIVAVGNLVNYPTKKTIHADGLTALPGFIDTHMHVESSMLTPANFAKVVLQNGTTSCAADPHEIANVLGIEGVKALINAGKDLPLHIYFYAPSTIPSAPGYETSGYQVGAKEMDQFMNTDGIYGLGEVMDFNGVVNGEDLILSVINQAKKYNAILDGHVPLLMDEKLQAFRAVGIDSDHCVNNVEKLLQEQALGFTTEVQGHNLSKEIVEVMNSIENNNRLCICTDDVSLTILLNHGHLNYAVEQAIELGLDPIKAIRFTTINPADRMRLYDTGAIVPGRKADIQLVKDIRHPYPTTVLSRGNIVVEDSKYVGEEIENTFPEFVYHSVELEPLTLEDLCASFENPTSIKEGHVIVNTMKVSGGVFQTSHTTNELPFHTTNNTSIIDYEGFVKMIIFNRHGIHQHAYSFIEKLGDIHGAVAITYGHDSHNLTLYGSNDEDLLVAANTVIGSQGGFAAVQDGKVLSHVPLPIAGLLSEESPEHLQKEADHFRECCKKMGFDLHDPLHFFTFMPLAVCPDIRCTDKGLLDVIKKEFIPLIVEIKE